MVDLPRDGWSRMTSLMCHVVGGLSAGAAGKTEPCVLCTWQKQGFRKQQEGKPQMANAFQASVWVTAEEEFPVMPKSGTQTSVK